VNASPTVLLDSQLHLPTDIDFAPGIDDVFFVSQLGGVNSNGSDGDDVTNREGRIVLMNAATGEIDYNNPFLTIGDTDLLDPYGVPEVGLFSTAFHPADLIAGRNGGGWDGPAGIVSSPAAASGGTRTVGYQFDGNGVARVAFAAAGDADLDGKVDVFDLVRVDASGTYGSGGAAGSARW
jgi:hypothetical protein